MSCGGNHLGFPISIKNRKFVEDLPMIIPGQFGFADRKSKMAATAGHRLTLDPMGKYSNAFFSEQWFQRRSVLKHFSLRVQC
jgi:hypothetical protein